MRRNTEVRRRVHDLGFGSNEPVKGIDGNAYQICPECDDDMLQYSGLMEEIKLKVEAIQRLMEIPGIINQTRVESVCLQLRMVLELIISAPWFPTRTLGENLRLNSGRLGTSKRS